MKVTAILLCSFVLTSCSFYREFKQEKVIRAEKVPAKVREAFLLRHPGVAGTFHEVESDEVESYEVNYSNGDHENSETFSASGVLLETEEEITLFDIPSADLERIRSFLVEEDKDSQTLKVQKVFSDKFSGYELKVKTIKSRTLLMEYFFKTDGSFHQKEEIELKPIQTLY